MITLEKQVKALAQRYGVRVVLKALADVCKEAAERNHDLWMDEGDKEEADPLSAEELKVFAHSIGF